jgi:NAD(P)-dependent dehydrogenase (short-subunit alcohol dehydrogenase family)
MIAYGMAFPDKIDGMTKEMEKIPLKRVGDPEKDIGPVAVFLASSDYDFVTGQTLMVDGGLHMS